MSNPDHSDGVVRLRWSDVIDNNEEAIHLLFLAATTRSMAVEWEEEADLDPFPSTVSSFPLPDPRRYAFYNHGSQVMMAERLKTPRGTKALVLVSRLLMSSGTPEFLVTSFKVV